MRFGLNAYQSRTFSMKGAVVSMAYRYLAITGVALSSTFAVGLSYGEQTDTKEIVVADPKPETVYSWTNQRCEDIDIPDAPARALRLLSGKIVLIAPHYNNRILAGDGFAHLAKDCGISGSGHELADPSKFDDRFWLNAIWPTAHGNILALTSHEFHGKRHPGSCSIDPKERVRCWYSSIAIAQASEGDLNFKLVPLETRIAAGPLARYSTDGPARQGFFTASNIFRHDGFLYTLIYQEGAGPDNRGGNCLFRARENAPLDWTGLGTDGNWHKFPNPYLRDETNEQTPHCNVVGRGIFSQFVTSVFYVKRWSSWVALFSRRSKGPDGGTYYSISTDLIHWSKATQLEHSVEPWADMGGCSTYYAYPSLLDHKSDSRLFDTGGDDLWLYMTRFNFERCEKGLNRDLVRYKLIVR